MSPPIIILKKNIYPMKILEKLPLPILKMR